MQVPRIARRGEAMGALASMSTLVASLLLLAAPVAAWDCSKIVIDKKKWDLGALGGPHSVVTWQDTSPTVTNTSYTVDICRPLARKGKVDEKKRCPDGTRVCAITHIHGDDDTDTIWEVIPISKTEFGAPFEAKPEYLKDSGSNADADRQGIRLYLKGGSYQKKKQQAIIEFECDMDFEGDENEMDPEDDYLPGGKPDNGEGKEDGDAEGDKRRKRDDEDGDDESGDADKGKEKQIIKEGAALKFISYGYEEKLNSGVLRLLWKTKHVCPKESSGGGGGGGGGGSEDQSSHWGFFTWLVVIVFLGVSAYLIFGSWLNYNRYGARGWDLVPHGDTIRDIPYLMKDWSRNVLNTVQGSGTRGGYSAV